MSAAKAPEDYDWATREMIFNEIKHHVKKEQKLTWPRLSELVGLSREVLAPFIFQLSRPPRRNLVLKANGTLIVCSVAEAYESANGPQPGAGAQDDDEA